MKGSSGMVELVCRLHHVSYHVIMDLGVLVAAKVPKARATSDDHIFLVWTSNLSSNRSIGIYCLHRY